MAFSRGKTVRGALGVGQAADEFYIEFVDMYEKYVSLVRNFDNRTEQYAIHFVHIITKDMNVLLNGVIQQYHSVAEDGILKHRVVWQFGMKKVHFEFTDDVPKILSFDSLETGNRYTVFTEGLKKYHRAMREIERRHDNLRKII